MVARAIAHGENRNGPRRRQDERRSLAPRSDLKLFRPHSPSVALGLAVNHLMTKPAFANLRFGDWSRILVGQINRKHYYFVVDGKNQIQGFIGWALTSQENAEAWVEGRGACPSRTAWMAIV